MASHKMFDCRRKSMRRVLNRILSIYRNRQVPPALGRWTRVAGPVALERSDQASNDHCGTCPPVLPDRKRPYKKHNSK